MSHAGLFFFLGIIGTTVTRLGAFIRVPAFPVVEASEACGSELLEDELAEGLGCCVLLLRMDSC